MRLKNYRTLENFMLRYDALLIRLCLNSEQPVLVKMKRKKNSRGNICTTFDFDIRMKSGDIRRERLRTWNSNYLWLLTAVAADFPNVEFCDLTPPELQNMGVET